MENYKNNNQHLLQSQHSANAADLPRTAHFEYAMPGNDADGDDIGTDDAGSNKSTPYYTPLEFFQASFEFPSPKLEKVSQSHEDIAEHTISEQCNELEDSKKVELATPTPTPMPTTTTTTSSIPKSLASAASVKQLPSTSPMVNRKLRRFSLYERRSCSPQHLLIKNSSSMENNSESEVFAADKENAKPKFSDKKDDSIHMLSNSGNNSPIGLIDDTGSPKILMSNDVGVSRLSYSPKLLTSINNINLSGSPLGVISSAGYKNGNYFKFPEIDHVVQEHNVIGGDTQQEETTSYCDNQLRNRQRSSSAAKSLGSISPATHTKVRLKFSGIDVDNSRLSASGDEHESGAGRCFATTSPSKIDFKRNRKNKNNLTIKITDGACSTQSAQQSSVATTSPKPKTPTIKSTKEKALSLDSAARESELTIIVSTRKDSHASCDEIDAQICRPVASSTLQHTQRNISTRYDRASCERSMRYPSIITGSRSTSLSQLATVGDGMHSHGLCPVGAIPGLNKPPLSGSNFPRTPRRRLTGTTANSTAAERLIHHRKTNSADVFAADTELSEKPFLDAEATVVLKEADEAQDEDGEVSCGPAVQSTSSSATATPSTHRGSYKHTPMLHASNTNLKTLPEFLTLVEFTTTGGKDMEHPHKQKSMDLPSTTAHMKNPTSSSSTNLLQRRGSNHSLTLNLHGSCSNLLGSCRSGLSVSNYSLGSVTNSTTNLNSKSTCNLELNSSHVTQPLNNIQSNAVVTQGAKQTLFRRRGSNHSLTLTNLAATSCGNLNSFASQNSLNVDRTPGSYFKVTRTTSFITPTHNTASSTTPKRGLLERRGSNQSLTLNMGSSFGGIGTERHLLATSNLYLGDTCAEEADADLEGKLALPTCCGPQTPHRRFFSSESLNRVNTQFSDLNQTHRRNAQHVCFGSVSDLKPGAYSNMASTSMEAMPHVATDVKRENFNFPESKVCSCTGVRNIMTRPLSPQSTSEEFKIYLANIQMLQNASNALNQIDLIKLNYVFDNSYASNNKGLVEQSVPMLSVRASKEAETPPGVLVSTSEDCEVADRYQAVVEEVLQTVLPNESEQRRIFCDIHKEFWDLPLNHQEKPMIFGSQAKNRYKTILPNETSRVLLEKEGKQLAEFADDIKDEHTKLAEDILRQLVISDEVPYINANYIKGPDYTSKCYVATQGPLPNTIFEFWLMVYQNTRKHFQTLENKTNSPQYYQKVIMLTNFLESNRQKCAVYFPVELNEIFITTCKQEVVEPTATASNFFNTYVQTNKTISSPSPLRTNEANESAQAGIEYYKADVSADLQQQLPPNNANYFVIKNIGIVRKNGFSIRKLVVLYCINISDDSVHLANTEDVNRDGGQLLINRFYCYHYWYPDWPDHRSPRDINTLLDICLHILNTGKCEAEFETFSESESNISSPSRPHIEVQPVELYQQDIFNVMQPLPVIHCSAGIGRTGCLTAILNGIRQLRQSFAYSLTSMAAEVLKEREAADATQVLSPVDFTLPRDFVEQAQHELCIWNKDTDSSFTRNTIFYINYILRRHKLERTRAEDVHWSLPSLSELPKMPDIFVDILGIVCNLRLQRGGMVQNSEQYELIHRAVCLYLKRTFALKRF